MFRKKREKAVSASRFCIRASELPYARLYRFDRFTVAISKFAEHSVFPAGDWPAQGPTAFGVLHGSAVYSDEQEPQLPVQVHFDRRPARNGSFGSAYFDRSTVGGEYVLNVTVADTEGEVARAVRRAFERSILSGFNFFHLDCVRARRPERDDAASQADIEEAEKNLAPEG